MLFIASATPLFLTYSLLLHCCHAYCIKVFKMLLLPLVILGSSQCEVKNISSVFYGRFDFKYSSEILVSYKSANHHRTPV